eukprot:TRINITY_DN16644_c0_g3_i1.p1 TRINITY_DN16644_c0_g3~~TRINITY_DN16644_c0_g3_i1.p1  ORF type:complete len:906 (+),score=169.07 TRINITY_DN16644_c0_g3_i1:113-2830(+)
MGSQRVHSAALLARAAALVAEIIGLAVVVLGAFIAFGPYQHDGTWNLVRDSAQSVEIDIPEQQPTHFRVRQLIPSAYEAEWRRDAQAWLRAAPPVLFLPGHNGKWTQTINIMVHVNAERRASFFSVDYHASACALHGSLVVQQAEFAAAAMVRISELYAEAGRPNTRVVILAHSMGVVIAQEAVNIVTRRGLGSVAGQMVLLSGPVLGHPLVLEPASADVLARARRQLWVADADPKPPWAVALSGGDTDALVPTEVAALPALAHGASLRAPTVRDVHSAFSHVNLMFSRHMLAAVVRLVSGALDGQLASSAAALRSPLAGLFRRRALEKPLARGQAPGGGNEGPVWLLARPDLNGGASFARFSADALPEVVAASSSSVPLLRAIPWEKMSHGQFYVLPAALGEHAVFTLVLVEKPKPIRRPIEKSSRGENFDAGDRVNCSKLAVVYATVFDASSAQMPTEWTTVQALEMQYPAKVCIFRFRPGVVSRDSGAVPAVVVERLSGSSRGKKTLDVSGWAQWHDDPLGATVDSSGGSSASVPAAFPALNGPIGWLWAALGEVRLRLPAGRAALSRVETGLGSWAPFLPLDFLIESEATMPVASPRGLTSWGLTAVALAAQADGQDVLVSTLAAGASRGTFGWAAESAPGIFSPRFLPDGSALGVEREPMIFILGHPEEELTVRVCGNVWAALGRLFRTYLGYLLGAWLGASLFLHAMVLDTAAASTILPCRGWRFLLRVMGWGLASSLCARCSTAAPGADASSGYSPGPVPLAFLLVLHLLGLALASLSDQLAYAVGSLFAFPLGLLSCCGRRGLWAALPCLLRVVLDITLWTVGAAVHPSLCLVVVMGRSFLLRAAATMARGGSRQKACAGGVATHQAAMPTLAELWMQGSLAGSTRRHPKGGSRRRC